MYATFINIAKHNGKLKSQFNVPELERNWVITGNNFIFNNVQYCTSGHGMLFTKRHLSFPG